MACPAHSLRPAIKAMVHPGERLPVAVNRRNFNRRPKATLTSLSVPQADRYSSHAFRRGSAQEMAVTSSPFQSSHRLEFGDQMPCAATSTWRPASKETRGCYSAWTSDPNRRRRYRHIIGLGLKTPLAGQAMPLFPMVSGIYQAYLAKLSVRIIPYRRNAGRNNSAGGFSEFTWESLNPRPFDRCCPLNQPVGPLPPLLFER